MGSTATLAQIHWRPDIGDPTIVGWVTVVTYFTTAALSLRCAAASGSPRTYPGSASEKTLWYGIALTMLLLGINKQLDLQTLFTEAGRLVALRQGWYHHRRMVQFGFIAGLILSAVFLVVWAKCKFITVWRKNRLAVIGSISLVCFIIIRASSFHHVDQLMGNHFSGIALHRALELGGIGCLFLSAACKLRGRRTARTSTAAPANQDVFM